tara:strand:+ start:4787 stop:5026 length:240 start_codon:yes stop_codon:yes gene_type:complete
VLYGLWLISALIIISEDGFSARYDVPWFVFFSAILFIFWAVKYKATGDNRFFFYHNISDKHQRIYLIFFAIFSISMVVG